MDLFQVPSRYFSIHIFNSNLFFRNESSLVMILRMINKPILFDIPFAAKSTSTNPFNLKDEIVNLYLCLTWNEKKWRKINKLNKMLEAKFRLWIFNRQIIQKNCWRRINPFAVYKENFSKLIHLWTLGKMIFFSNIFFYLCCDFNKNISQLLVNRVSISL